jgi:hypothetical protein
MTMDRTFQNGGDPFNDMSLPNISVGSTTKDLGERIEKLTKVNVGTLTALDEAIIALKPSEVCKTAEGKALYDEIVATETREYRIRNAWYGALKDHYLAKFINEHSPSIEAIKNGDTTEDVLKHFTLPSLSIYYPELRASLLGLRREERVQVADFKAMSKELLSRELGFDNNSLQAIAKLSQTQSKSINAHRELYDNLVAYEQEVERLKEVLNIARESNDPSDWIELSKKTNESGTFYINIKSTYWITGIIGANKTNWYEFINNVIGATDKEIEHIKEVTKVKGHDVASESRRLHTREDVNNWANTTLKPLIIEAIDSDNYTDLHPEKLGINDPTSIFRSFCNDFGGGRLNWRLAFIKYCADSDIKDISEEVKLHTTKTKGQRISQAKRVAEYRSAPETRITTPPTKAVDFVANATHNKESTEQTPNQQFRLMLGRLTNPESWNEIADFYHKLLISGKLSSYQTATSGIDYIKNTFPELKNPVALSLMSGCNVLGEATKNVGYPIFQIVQIDSSSRMLQLSDNDGPKICADVCNTIRELSENNLLLNYELVECGGIQRIDPAKLPNLLNQIANLQAEGGVLWLRAYGQWFTPELVKLIKSCGYDCVDYNLEITRPSSDLKLPKNITEQDLVDSSSMTRHAFFRRNNNNPEDFHETVSSWFVKYADEDKVAKDTPIKTSSKLLQTFIPSDIQTKFDQLYESIKESIKKVGKYDELFTSIISIYPNIKIPVAHEDLNSITASAIVNLSYSSSSIGLDLSLIWNQQSDEKKLDILTKLMCSRDGYEISPASLLAEKEKYLSEIQVNTHHHYSSIKLRFIKLNIDKFLKESKGYSNGQIKENLASLNSAISNF